MNKTLLLCAGLLAGFSLMAAQPLTLPETVVQAKVDFKSLGRVIAQEAGKENFAKAIAEIDADAKRSSTGKFVSVTNVCWVAASLEFSPNMVVRQKAQPEFSFAVMFDKDVAFLREFADADGHLHRDGLIETDFYTCDDLYFDLIENRLLVGSSSEGLLKKWQQAYACSPVTANDAILPTGCLFRVETAPVSSLLENFGVKPYLLAAFEEFGDPDLGACLAAIGKLTLELTHTPEEFQLVLEVASENAEAREIVGTIFSSFALSVRLGADILAVVKEDLPFLTDRQAREALTEYRDLYQRAFKARHLPASERLELHLGRERFVTAVKNAMKGPRAVAAASSSAMVGRQLFVGIVQANVEREAVGLSGVWPKTAETRSDEKDDIAGQVFASSTDYFAALLDLQNQGKAEWSPYLVDVDPSVVMADGRAKWIVIAGSVENLADDIPVLVSSNVDLAELNEGRFRFTGDHAIVVMKGGAAQVIRNGKKTRTFGPLPHGVRYLAP